MNGKAIFCSAVLLVSGALLGSCGGKSPSEEGSQPVHFAAQLQTETENTEAAEAETTETETTEAETTESPAEPVALPDEQRKRADMICAKYSAVGVQAAVLRDAKPCFTYEYGLADKENGVGVCADTKFRVASLSKLVTDMVFMAMSDRGIVSETEDVSDALGYRVRNPYYPDVPITPSMLMSHTSSVCDTNAIYDAIYRQSSVPLKSILSGGSCFSGSRPGTSCAYSNFGLALVGAVCEKAAGRCFDELAHEYLFDPLGIDASYTASGLKDPSLLAALYGSGGYSKETQLALHFREPGETYHLMQGNLTLSAKDYALLLSVLSNGGKSPDGREILSAGAAAAIPKERIDIGSCGIGYGVQLQDNVIDGKTVCVHTGSNYGMFSAYAFSPETGDGVVVLTSGADGSKDPVSEVYNICLELIRLMYPG